MDHDEQSVMTAPELARRVRAAEPSAVLVSPRVIRRVIRAERELSRPLAGVPHRKSYVIPAAALRRLVEPQELDLPDDLPAEGDVILLVRPSADALETRSAARVLTGYWRLLFHAKIDQAMQHRVASGELTLPRVLRQIDAIGQAAFDEIRDVLRKEGLLLPPGDSVTVYCEFVAVFLELRHFLPDALASYFPSIDDYERVYALVRQHVDDAGLVASARLAGAPQSPQAPQPAAAATASGGSAPAVVYDARERRIVSRRLARRANRAASLGNAVRSAALHLRVAELASGDQADGPRRDAYEQIERLAARLVKALGPMDDADDLPHTMMALADRGDSGFRAPGRRILYDLQRVCVDHERDIYKLDLVEWVLRRGEAPLRRRLPKMEWVRMHQHLSRALRRLGSAKLPRDARDRLTTLLTPKLHAVEKRVRDTLRPDIRQAFEELGPRPRSVPEQVGRDKLIDELLDRVISHGFVSMGDLRDAISRNNLKLTDVTTTKLIRGDELLRLDKALSRRLDGVYRRGEVYRRWPQRLSSLAFGTRIGRFITRYLAVPYLGAYIGLAGLQHIVHLFSDQIHLDTPLSVLLVGTLLLWLLYAPQLRRALFKVARFGVARAYGVVVELPAELMRVQWIKRVVRNRAVRWLWRYGLKPAMLGLLVGFVLYDWGVKPNIAWTTAGALFLMVNLLVNTRFGRDVEEFGHDLLVRLWRRYIWRGLYNLGLWLIHWFAQAMDAIDRALYNVDEWMRFKSGETRLTFIGKLVGGTLWFFISYIAVFCVTLLIEPQVNPIKHFPVVTVSHKILLGMVPAIANALSPLFGGSVKDATIFVGSVIWLIPGIFGYLAWELKENWRMYAANRPNRLRPAIIGGHGETMARLLRPGFHSGTVPKLYAKLRKTERRRPWQPVEKAHRKHRHALHHVEESVEHFVQRDLANLLAASERWQGGAVHARHVRLGSNSIRIALTIEPGDHAAARHTAARLCFEEQSGWLVAAVEAPGWLAALPAAQRDVFEQALAGFYKLAAVDLVREQLESSLGLTDHTYDIDDRGIVIWPRDSGGAVSVIALDRTLARDAAADNGRGTRTDAAEGDTGPPPPAGGVKPRQPAVFRAQAVMWAAWVRAWANGDDAEADAIRLVSPSLMRDAASAASDPSQPA